MVNNWIMVLTFLIDLLFSSRADNAWKQMLSVVCISGTLWLTWHLEDKYNITLRFMYADLSCSLWYHFSRLCSECPLYVRHGPEDLTCIVPLNGKHQPWSTGINIAVSCMLGIAGSRLSWESVCNRCVAVLGSHLWKEKEVGAGRGWSQAMMHS